MFYILANVLMSIGFVLCPQTECISKLTPSTAVVKNDILCESSTPELGIPEEVYEYICDEYECKNDDCVIQGVEKTEDGGYYVIVKINNEKTGVTNAVITYSLDDDGKVKNYASEGQCLLKNGRTMAYSNEVDGRKQVKSFYATDKNGTTIFEKNDIISRKDDGGITKISFTSKDDGMSLFYTNDNKYSSPILVVLGNGNSKSPIKLITNTDGTVTVYTSKDNDEVEYETGTILGSGMRGVNSSRIDKVISKLLEENKIEEVRTFSDLHEIPNYASTRVSELVELSETEIRQKYNNFIEQNGNTGNEPASKGDNSDNSNKNKDPEEKINNYAKQIGQFWRQGRYHLWFANDVIQ